MARQTGGRADEMSAEVHLGDHRSIRKVDDTVLNVHRDALNMPGGECGGHYHARHGALSPCDGTEVHCNDHKEQDPGFHAIYNSPNYFVMLYHCKVNYSDIKDYAICFFF